MSVQTVRTVVQRFLESETCQVLVLKGGWGVGKTFAWNQLVREIGSKIKPAHYCYVSLFGISSLADLRLAIFANTIEVVQIGKKITAATINEDWMRLGWRGIRWAQQRLGALRETPYLKQVAIGLDILAPHLIAHSVVCLDDFERLNDTRIPPDELLGYVTSLKEEKDCKVVLIFNEDELRTKKETYEKYRDKVIDIELLFAPTTEEAADLALPKDLPCREVVVQRSKALDIKNLRILHRIVAAIGLIFPKVKDLHSRVHEQMVITVVLVAWTYYEANDAKPSLAFLRRWNTVKWFMKDEAKIQAQDDKHKAWATLLNTYGFGYMDEFDLAIAIVIEHGYTEESGLEITAAAQDAQFRANDLDNSFTKAWDLFHDTFADNKDALVAALSANFRTSVQYISPINLNGTVKLLRELGENALADELVEFYIDARKDQNQLFNVAASHFRNDIDDPTVRKRFEEIYKANEQLPTLLEAATHIAKESGWSPPQLDAMKNATADDFYNLFKTHHGDDLGRIVKTSLQFEGMDGYEALGKTARIALERIGKESVLNAIRVRRYGVKV